MNRPINKREYPGGVCRYVTSLAVLFLSFFPASSATFAGDDPVLTGEQIYRQKCASCHGVSGEGTDEHYPRPLIGERPVASLTRLIAKTMPEDAPGECVGADAERVAAYIYETFYSKAAQAQQISTSADRTVALDGAPVSKRGHGLDRELSQLGPLGCAAGSQG